jgi:hypothetical protein
LTVAVLLPAAMGPTQRAETAARGPGLTIYAGDLALVRQTVERSLSAGPHTVRIDGLPTTVDLSSLIVLDEEATLLGVHGFREYQDASGSGASVELDLDVARALENLQIAFLSTGLGWSADYALIVRRDDASARMDGFADLTNNSGASFEGAEVQLLAGSIQRGGEAFGDARLSRAAAGMLEMEVAPELLEAAFGDYHLYTVSSPLTLRAGERRRIRLMGTTAAKTQKLYTFSHSATYYEPVAEPLTQAATVSYRVERGEGGEFGDTPLPAGQVRIFQEDAGGRLQLLGISGIGNTPANEDLLLSTGRAFDVVGTRTQTDYERPSSNVFESAWRIELRNRGEKSVSVQVLEGLSGDWEIVQSTQRAEKLSAATVRFVVDVPARGQASLEYRVRVRS